jgi:hypothetical protein
MMNKEINVMQKFSLISNFAHISGFVQWQEKAHAT